MASLRRRRRGGFTVLELITATAIMAMIALTLYQAMRIGFKARDRAIAAVGPARAAELAIDTVRRDLESALPLRGILAGTGMFLAGDGTEVPGTGAVQFYAMAPLPPQAGITTGQGIGTMSRGPSSLDNVDPVTYGGGVRRVELLVRPSTITGAGGVLVRRVVGNLLAPTEPVPEEEVICRGITAFTVRYFDGLQWYAEWDSTQYGDTMPMAVEVSLEVHGSKDPTRTAADTRGDVVNEATYRTSRTFFLPCRDEAALLQGGG